MVLVVSDVETDQLVCLIVLALPEREDQTTVFLLRVVQLEVLLAAVFEPGVRQFTGITDGHRDDIALLHLRGIEVTGTKEDGHHVVDAVLIGAGLPDMLTAGRDAMLLQLTVATGS